MLSAHSYDTQSRIQNALDAGYEVTVHERPITQSGWTGAGFISIDPSTGAGVYTIEGGANGGRLSVDLNPIFIIVGAIKGAIAFTLSTAYSIFDSIKNALDVAMHCSFGVTMAAYISMGIMFAVTLFFAVHIYPAIGFWGVVLGALLTYIGTAMWNGWVK